MRIPSPATLSIAAMDILFSPYGVGGIFKETMAEIERTTVELLKPNTFQQMLDLENKFKIDRLRGHQTLLCPSHSSHQLKDHSPTCPERTNSSLPHETFLMTKAARRTVVPPLSVAIPQGIGNERKSGRELEEEAEGQTGAATPMNSDPHQKQVKFLDEEDGMSEQSSICQSPSWEGYGQRKKEKKLEAERRKKEKEQADKEARAARKRTTARLSKPPPLPSTGNHEPKSFGLTAADRSMSAPLLVSSRDLQIPRSIPGLADPERAASSDDIVQTRWRRLAMAGALVDSDSNARRVRGNAEDDPSSRRPESSSNNGDSAPLQELRRSISEGPESLSQHPSSAPSAKHEIRSPHETFPPSASRTPRLRHLSVSAGGVGSNPSQGTSSADASKDLLPASPAVDGARRGGYVHHQRIQAAEHAMAGLVDEQLTGGAGQYYPPSRSSTRPNQHARRLSLTQEAKSVALKLVGLKTSSARDNPDQTDYTTFKAIPYSSSGIDGSSAASIPASLKDTSGYFRGREDERPPTPQCELSSVTGSEPSNQNRKSRGLRGATKAVLSMSKTPQKPADGPKPSTPMPPHLRLRPHVRPRTSIQVEHTEISATTTTGQRKLAKATHQGDSQAFEGSSSSSAYGDGSQFPSPATTPDTSRPQSAKDVPLSASCAIGESDKSLKLEDDQQTLRHSLDSSKSTRPRADDSRVRKSAELGDGERPCSAAPPSEVDCDTESFITTVSRFDTADDAEHTSPISPSSPDVKTPGDPLHLEIKADIPIPGASPEIPIPPRSRKRSQSSSYELSAASPPTGAGQKNGKFAAGLTGPGIQHGGTKRAGERPDLRAPRSHAEHSQRAEAKRRVEVAPERDYKNCFRKPTRPHPSGTMTRLRDATSEDGVKAIPGSARRERATDSISSARPTAPSAVSAAPHSESAEPMPSEPCVAKVPDLSKSYGISGEALSSAGSPSPMSSPSALQTPAKPATDTQRHSVSAPSPASAATSGASTSSTRPHGMPISIPKQPKSPASDPSPPQGARPQALPALPKHRQLQANTTGARAGGAAAEARMAPIAKMLVECCSCRFYHDMPSKLYECMAKPDAVVEDKQLGISGAITTMVKCPWCHHNMSRNCCAGYAAIVYLKEKLH